MATARGWRCPPFARGVAMAHLNEIYVQLAHACRRVRKAQGPPGGSPTGADLRHPPSMGRCHQRDDLQAGRPHRGVAWDLPSSPVSRSAVQRQKGPLDWIDVHRSPLIAS